MTNGKPVPSRSFLFGCGVSYMFFAQSVQVKVKIYVPFNQSLADPISHVAMGTSKRFPLVKKKGRKEYQRKRSSLVGGKGASGRP